MTDDELRAAVAASRSWRGVLRAVGRTSPRYGRELKARCDALGISYEHFRAGPSDDVVRAAVAQSQTWAEAVVAAGYAEMSGSARAQLKKRCSMLRLSTAHLDAPAPAEALAPSAQTENLREAGPLLLAAHLTLCGLRVSWPLEPAPYDLLVEGRDGLRRVQVKTTTTRVNGTWQCGLTRSLYDGASGYTVSGYYLPGEIDDFGIVDGDLFAYLIPYHLVAGQGSLQVRKYARFRLGSPHPGPLIR